MVWVFGYGSLVWKVGFLYERKVVGYVEGFIRRFWWWSEDHRGVPGAPGRVVSLIPSDDPRSRVWGVAYEISDELWRQQVEQQLDHRERAGYTQHNVLFHPKSEGKGGAVPVPVTLYIGQLSHRQYAGPADLAAIAQTIARSAGPSGKNKDYLYNLADTMREIDPEDEHLYELEKAVRRLEVCQDS